MDWEKTLLPENVWAPLNKEGDYTVYQSIDPDTGEVKYVGITKRDPDVRFNEHLNSGTERAGLRYKPIETGFTPNQKTAYPKMKDGIPIIPQGTNATKVWGHEQIGKPTTYYILKIIKY